MSISVGKYSFDAWLRRGIGLQVHEVDTLGASGGALIERATVPVGIDVNSTPAAKDFALLGPGDLVGVVPAGIVRTEPRDGVTDQEPNYLPFVEFYEEDFLWRYTPARAAGAKLRPWLALLVLEDATPGNPGEFTRQEHRLPLPTITVTKPGALPNLTQSWAWAHVHVNEAFADETEFERFLESLEAKDHPNSDRIICRLSCPRRLEANTAYAAFLVPAFETGRLAGLELDPSQTPAQQPAWSTGAGTAELPVYHQWSFRTGDDEDFESLVRKLEPRPVDPRVGIRDMDGEKPGWGLTEETDIGLIKPPPGAPAGTQVKQWVLGLEGALKAPDSHSRPPAVDPTRPFFEELEKALNFPQELRETPSGKKLPVVSPPIYGEQHALRHTVDASHEDWLDDLNRDPRLRVPAGFGTRVIQKGQEGYVARAWAQVQKVMEANSRIRLVNWAMRVGQAQQASLGAEMAPTSKLILFAPLLAKVRGSATTLRGQLDESTLPAAALSGAMRRLLRARGPVGRRLASADPTFSHAALVEGMATGDLTAAPPKPVPGDLVTDQSAGAGAGLGAPGGLIAKLGSRLGLLVLPLLALLIVFLVLALAFGAWLIGALIALIGALLGVGGAVATAPEPAAAGVADPAKAAAAVAASSVEPGFGLHETDPAATAFDPGPPGADSAEGHDFRAAAEALERRLAIRAPQSEPRPFDLDNADKKLSRAIDPQRAFPLLLTSEVQFPFDPEWLLDPEHLIPAMAYPDFDDPMYEGLRDISPELLLPNIELIPQNTITLLESNPPFIESYMVGLNCEFGKELLWREYPTDERGSYFRQFWDLKGIIAMAPSESAAELSERSKDIVPIDTWPANSALGTHRNPKRGPGEQLVLAVRGELLRKYPNTLIYAQRAHPYHDSHGKADPSRPPVLGEVATDADVKREIKFPIFKGKIDPDVRFFGFDLDEAEARGAEHPSGEADDWGYYFVIQQLPGEPRFGMDIAYEPDDDPATPITWDDLAWDRFPAEMAFIDPAVGPQNFHPGGAGESLGEWGTDSARMASILFQRPVMIAVHAKEMLEGLG
jgi:hypothetical protein